MVYASTPEHPSQVLVVPAGSVESAFKKLNDFRDPYLLASSTSDYAFIRLTLDKADKSAAPKVALVLEKKDDGLWEYKDPAGYDGAAEQGDSGAPPAPGKPPSGVDGLLNELSKIKAESTDKESDFVADDVKDLAQYNLDAAKSDVLTIYVDRIDSIGKDDDGAPRIKKTPVEVLIGVAKKVDDKAENPKYYALLKGDHGNTLVKVSAKGPDAIALLFKEPTVLCSHTLVALGGFKKPIAVDVVNPSGKLEFRRETGEKPWQLYRDGKEVPVDQAAVEGLVNQLVQPGQVHSFLDPKDAKSDLEKLGLKQPTVMASIWVDGVEKEEEKKEEKKDDKGDDKKEEKKARLVLAKDKVDKPAARLLFGAVADNLVVIKREANHKDWSESALVKASDLLLDQVKAGPLAYYDKKLPKYNEGFTLPDKGLVKLTLDRGAGEHFVVSRADSKQETPWKFEEPKDWASQKPDPSVVMGVLATLNGLRATRLVAEDPKPDDIDKEYGLKTPALKAVVAKDDMTSYTFEFGAESKGADGKPDGGQYARQSQRPMVFVVNKSDVELLQKELRDRAIFAFDPAKVKALKMSGWQKISGGAVQARDLERKDDKTWTVKMPPDLAMNMDKVNKIVDDLSKLQAERFIGQNAAIKAEYDKESPKNAFTVEMTVEGEKDAFVVKVVDLTGDQTLPEADRQVYASTPRLPGELVQVKRTLFTAPAGKPQELGPMDQPGYFAP